MRADVVLIEIPGQLGNQLRVLANVLAASIEMGFEVRAPGFKYPDFTARGADLVAAPAGRVPNVPRFVSPLLRRLRLRKHVFSCGKAAYVNITAAHDLRGRPFELDSPEFRATLDRFERLYLAGFGFRDFGAIERNKERVLDLLRPNDAVKRAAEAHVGAIRKTRPFVVGLHVRRGDYQTFASGRYSFGDIEYASLMRGLLERLGRADAAVMVCSNESTDFAAYAGLNVYAGPGGAYEDLVALSMTDLLVGPPSTFSGWASFMGSVPKIEIVQADVPLDPASAFVAPC